MAVRKNDCVRTDDDSVTYHLAAVALGEDAVVLHGSGLSLDCLVVPASELDGKAVLDRGGQQITFAGVGSASGRLRSVLSEPTHLGIQPVHSTRRAPCKLQPH